MSEPASGVPAPVFWPALTPAEAELEWPALRDWVVTLGARFPHATRVPPCWWQHNDLVELLAALRDFERACYGAAARLTGPVEWHGAFQDIERRLEMWVKRLGCAVGREHFHLLDEDGWRAFVAADIAARAAAVR
ncbi:MAG: hypothetical protein EPN43_01910 [Jatrophihabitans sp.]|nr:MAG: hypothetical protein EPN43_01910 [Jatrophihabitans sp.]